MEDREQRKKVNALTVIAQGQSIGGKVISIGEGMVSLKSENFPYRILDDAPVYYSGNNEFNMYDISFRRDKTYKWGQFYHPYMMFGSPPIGGINKLYVDTRIDGWYLLWILSRLDPEDFVPADWFPSIVSWTPRQMGDSVRLAGYRLFWAAALAMDDVKSGDYYNDDNYENGLWKDDWVPSPLCFQVFASIRTTRYKDEKKFNDTLSEAPDFLKQHLISRRFIV